MILFLSFLLEMAVAQSVPCYLLPEPGEPGKKRIECRSEPPANAECLVQGGDLEVAVSDLDQTGNNCVVNTTKKKVRLDKQKADFDKGISDRKAKREKAIAACQKMTGDMKDVCDELFN